MNVIGIDLSLTCTGIAIITPDEVTTQRVVSRGKADATLEQRTMRLHNLALDISNTVWDSKPELVLIEAPAFSRSNPGMHDRSGLWWMIVQMLDSLVIVEVSPTCRCRYATGRGNASKDDVLSAVVRRYAGVDVNGNDEADALILAAMGARHLGHPIEVSLPQANLAALAGVHWPDMARIQEAS
jgi:crossover junction endodeoxyribonuclease RuvC